MTQLDKDRSIISQVAAKIVATQVSVLDTEAFAAATADVFNTIVSLGTATAEQQAVVAAQTAAQAAVTAPAVPTPAPAPVQSVDQAIQAIQAVGGAFPGAQVVAPQAPTAPVAQVGGFPEVLKVGPWPLPEWLPAQYAASKCTPGEPLWDNRKDLPMFGGTRSEKSPWFKGKESGEGVWPPKG